MENHILNNYHSHYTGGVIKLLEAEIQRPVHWFVCMLHGNELPLRHILATIDGKTSGPKCFNGPIGKQLQDCEKLSVVNFLPVPLDLGHEVNLHDLSTDQKYLLEICRAVAVGEVPESLSIKFPGNLNHSRWVTTANRKLRLYVVTEDPTKNLRDLVSFIMTVYVPMWFNIKCYLSVCDTLKRVNQLD